ncbi:MAG: SLBB domain-containing protein [Ignavibacteria bacterium]|nr:SLBB domain-containing protein [Ignavibacteria bacterium]
MKLKIAFVFALLLCYSYTYSQIENPLDKNPGKTTNPTLPSTTSSPTKINADAPQLFGSISDANVHSKTTPVEGVIKSNEYIVGPNDLFTLGLYGFVNQQVPLYVSLEGSVIIPTVGEISIADITLKEAKEKVIKAVKKRYYSSDVSFSLTQPRTFLIKVNGLSQGIYEVSPVMRVSDLMSRVFYDTTNITNVYNQKFNEAEFFQTQTSMRNILLTRKNGSVVKVDLYKYFITGDSKYNPQFLEGDLLKIPMNQLDKNFITISGAVQLGGGYEYSPDDDLSTVVGLARGFDTYAEEDSIIIYRPYINNKGFDVIPVSYSNNKNFPIQNFDRIFVKYKTDFRKKVTALILGEVPRPGYYPISFKATTVKDLIEMAGGVTENAYLPLCIIFRKYDKEYSANDSTEIFINQRANDLLVTDKDKQNFDIDIKSRRGRVIIDFEKLIKQNDLSQNIILEDDDIVYINDNKQVVYVYGAVNSEGYVKYIEGKDYEYYIEKAGGYGLGADEGNTRIIKFNSRGWYKPDQTKIESGDFVYVPKSQKESFKDTMAILGTIVGIVGTIITSYILIQNSTK